MQENIDQLTINRDHAANRLDAARACLLIADDQYTSNPSEENRIHTAMLDLDVKNLTESLDFHQRLLDQALDRIPTEPSVDVETIVSLAEQICEAKAKYEAADRWYKRACEERDNARAARREADELQARLHGSLTKLIWGDDYPPY